MAVRKIDQTGMTKQKLLKAINAIESAQGEGSIYTLGSKKANLKMPRWSTGLEALDEILGGGMPYGRIIEIYGPESAGKTTLLYHLLAQHKVAVDIPIEGTFDSERAKLMGCNKNLIVNRARFGEQALEAVMTFAEAHVPIIGIDSVPHMITRKMFEEPDMEKDAQRGRIAAMLANQLPKIVEMIERTSTTLIFINQLRDSMNAMPFGPQTHTMGGRSLKHNCSVRLQVNKLSNIEIPNKNPRVSAKNEAIGIQMKIKVMKSKVCNPFGECILSLIFDTGFVSNDEVPAIRKARMQENTAKYKKIKRVLDDDDNDE